jgi:hypothetical protein
MGNTFLFPERRLQRAQTIPSRGSRKENLAARERTRGAGPDATGGWDRLPRSVGARPGPVARVRFCLPESPWRQRSQPSTAKIGPGRRQSTGPRGILLRVKRREYLRDLIWRDPLTQEFLRQPHPDRIGDDSSLQAQEAWKRYRREQDRIRRKWGATVRPLPPAPEDAGAGRYFGLGPAHANAYLRELAAKANWTIDEQESYRETMFRHGAPAVAIEFEDMLPQIEFTVNDGCLTTALLEKMHDLHTEGLSWWARGGCPASEGHLEPCGIHRSRQASDRNLPRSLTIKVPLVTFVPRSSEDRMSAGSDPLVGLARTDVPDIGQTVIQLVRAALRHLPLPPAPTADAGFLAPLRRTTTRSFQRALGHYDAYVERGLTIRDISRETGLGEDTVLRDVKLIWQAIHRRRFQARRRRSDAPALGAPPYHCESHPDRDCPKNCPTLRAWWQAVRRTLPTDQTGVGMSGLKRVGLDVAETAVTSRGYKTVPRRRSRRG